MKAEEWKQKQVEHVRLGRTIRDAVSRVYLVPSFHEEAIISTAIAIRAEDMAEVKVMAIHSGGAIRQSAISPITDVDALDVFTLEALLKVKIEVGRWLSGERDALPTAAEMGLLDPGTYNGPAYVIGRSEGTPVTREPRKTKVIEVDDPSKVTLAGKEPS